MCRHILHKQALHEAPVPPGALPGALRGAGGRGGPGLGLAQLARQALAPERLVHAAGGPSQRDHQRASSSLDIPARLLSLNMHQRGRCSLTRAGTPIPASACATADGDHRFLTTRSWQSQGSGHPELQVFPGKRCVQGIPALPCWHGLPGSKARQVAGGLAGRLELPPKGMRP